jgi:hypothetical protein
MRNIFKTFKENKTLLEENHTLKVQIEALNEFKKIFDDYYHSISSHKIIEKKYDNAIVLGGAFMFDNIDEMYCSANYCKKRVIDEIVKQLEPYIEFDLVDNKAYGAKTLKGRLTVVRGELK